MSISIREKQNISVRMGLILILLFTAALDLITRYYFFIFIAFFFFMLKSKRVYRFDASVGLLLVLAISWALFAPSARTSFLSLFKPFTYVMCYMMGHGFFDDGVENNRDKSPYNLFYTVLIVMASGTFTHYLLNWVINFNVFDRNTLDIWTGEVMAATGQASLACIPLGLSIAIISSKVNVRLKIASIATIVLVMMYNLILSGRTLIIMALAIVVIAFLHRLSISGKSKTRWIMISIAIVFVAILIYQNDVFQIKSYIEDSPFYARFFGDSSAENIGHDTRFQAKLDYLANLERSLFGGVHLRDSFGYAHDIILDTYDEAGIFALVAIPGYLILTATRLIKCVKNKTLPFVFKNTILCVYIIVYLEFMVEPILQGMPWFFATFCLIDGYVCRILRHNRMIKT